MAVKRAAMAKARPPEQPIFIKKTERARFPRENPILESRDRKKSIEPSFRQRRQKRLETVATKRKGIDFLKK